MSSTGFKSTLQITLVIFALVFGTGCGKQSTPTANQSAKLKLQLNWKPEPQFGGFYAAQVVDAYKKRGLDVEITAGGAGAPTVEMIGAGTVPFGIVSADEIIRARTKGNLIVGLFAVYQTNPQGIMTRASRGFKNIADVFSHPGTLAMERGLPYSDFLKNKYGFDKLKIVPSPFGDLSLYRSDENYAMQCFVTSEPLAASKIGIAPQSFLIAESGYNPYTTVLATSEAFLNANHSTAQAMTDAVRDGWRAYLADPAATNELMARLNPTMDAQTFTDSAQAQKPLIGTSENVGEMTEDRWKLLIDQLLELKVIEKAVAPKDCFVSLSK